MKTKATKLNGKRRRKTEPHRQDGLLTTGDMARLSQNTLRTVRFYEEEGLLTPRNRTEGGHRLFDRQELRKLLLVSDLRAAGLPLEDIRDMLHVKRHQKSGAAASRAVIERLEAQVKLLHQRVALLKRLASDLDAAKERLEACGSCSEPRSFPDGCNSCRVLKSNGKLPDALSVLWDVEP
jgi:DNA-binding transcriptional MerR regulator